MVGQDLIDEGFLPFQSFQCAATRDSIGVQGWIDDFWEQFRRRPKTVGGAPIPAVQRLAEHKLPAVRRVAEIEPVCDAASPTLHSVLDQLPGCPCVYAANHNVEV